MRYLALGLLVLLFAAIIARVFSPRNEPDFSLRGFLSDADLRLKLLNLAAASALCESKGAGLSLHLIKKNFAAFRRMFGSVEGRDAYAFETELFDNFYLADELMTALKKQRNAFSLLPHYSGLPRVYALCELIVKGSNGAVDAKKFAASVKTFCGITPLNNAEILNLKNALLYAYAEFLTVFAAKSVVAAKNARAARRDAAHGNADLSRLGSGAYLETYLAVATPETAKNLYALCEKNDIFIEDRVNNYRRLAAGYEGAVVGALGALREIDSWFNDEFLLSVSPLDELLSRESDSYRESTVATKFVYLFHIGRRARRAKKGEIAFVKSLLAEQGDLSMAVLPKAGGRGAMRLYICGAVFLSLVLCVGAGFLSGGIIGILVGVLFFPLALGIVSVLASELNLRFAFRRFMPRKEKVDAKTLIVFCALAANKEELAALFENLCTLACANPSEIFEYGLLLDFAASDRETVPEDAELLRECALKYADLGERFHVLVRRRKACEGGRFQGWERKRGALTELNDYLSGEGENNFALKLGTVPQVKYVLTLDSDMMINCAYELVQIMEHPHNADKTVVSLSARSSPKQINSYFSLFMSGEVGLGGYSGIPSGPEYDIFDSGNYTGKGIYRLREFRDKLKDFFPDNRILSHDFIEGAIVGCGQGEFGLDSFPQDYSSYLSREMRWLRGDLQLAPYLFRRVKNRSGERVHNPLSSIAKFHIFSNIVFGFLPANTLLILLLAFFSDRVTVTALVALGYLLFRLLNSIRATFVTMKPLFVKTFFGALIELALLPIAAWYSLCAIIVTAARMARGKNLLSWKVFGSRGGKIHWGAAVVVSVVFCALNVVFAKNVLFYIVIALFMSGIVLQIIGRKQIYLRKPKPSQLDELKALAFSTYSYFEKFNMGVLDNRQEAPPTVTVERVSPTDLGYALISHVCATALGFVERAEAENRIAYVFNKIKSAEKWQGNLYNWTERGAALSPRYVSAVDNGNLMACLMCAAEFVSSPLADEMRQVVSEIRIEKLFDFKRGLFYIGYDADRKSYDKGHYDLMASEAMLTYLVAIGLGRIPRKSFDNLSRGAYRYAGKKCLASWSGGLFEYLMSALFVEYPRRGMLFRSAVGALNAHIKFGRNLPFWGMSESQYNQTDFGGLYCYRAFGVPYIRNSSEAARSVVAPYASLLGLEFCPDAVCKNYTKIRAANMLGRHGCYEAHDGVPIKTYMTHHQGMILAAVTNYLTGGVLRDCLRKNPAIRAAELLLTQSEFENVSVKKFYKKSAASERKNYYCRAGYPLPLDFMSNGRYCLVADGLGGNFASFDGKRIFRYEGEGGLRFVVGEKAEFVHWDSAYSVVGKRIYEGTACGCEIKSETSAAIGFDGEIHRVKIRNASGKQVRFFAGFYGEPVLRAERDDLAHKAFSDMKLRFERDEADDFLVVRRVGESLLLAVFSDKNALFMCDRVSIFGGAASVEKEAYAVPAAYVRREICLKAGEESEFAVFAAVSNSREELNKIVRIARSDGYLRQVGGAASLSEFVGAGSALSRLAAALTAEAQFVRGIGGFCDGLPLVALNIGDSADGLLPVLRKLALIKKSGVDFNLLVVYNEYDGYLRKIESDVTFMAEIAGLNCGVGRIKILNYVTDWEQADKLLKIAAKPAEAGAFVSPRSLPKYPTAEYRLPAVEAKCAIGGFMSDSSYLFPASDNIVRPWCNVLADGEAGSVVSHFGGGFTFFGNSALNRVTTWDCDPVKGAITEGIVVGEGKVAWSAKCGINKCDSEYWVRHALGFSEWGNNYNGAITTQAEFVYGGAKYYLLKIENRTDYDRKFKAMFFADFVLGDFVFNTRGHLRFYAENHGLRIENINNGQCVYLLCDRKITYYVRHRQEVIDKNGDILPPRGSKIEVDESGQNFAGIVSEFAVPARSEGRIVFALSPTTELADATVAYSAAVRRDSSLSVLQAETGDRRMDLFLNRLPYQVLCCRYYARAGWYQAGGAYGFRDQLQDCLALLYVSPSLVRGHILTAAAHQFEEGDVQHWWHPPYLGVRTRISDDFLYLPYVTAEYIMFSGDKGILDENVPFIKGKKLRKDERDAYFAADPSTAAPLYLHCVKALLHNEIADNGLVKIGTGDWNDAMDRVGDKGEGTTVFGSMFLYFVIAKFMPHAREAELRKTLAERMEILRRGVCAAWEDDRFLRAFTDEGEVLGSEKSAECKLDLLTQSWSALSGIAPIGVAKRALKTALSLVDFDKGVIKLLAPPFDKIDAGYISEYPEGVRENGGQYTHAAVWYIMAAAEMGWTDYAYSLFKMIAPCFMADRAEYKTEPYALCGDVGSNGEGGWSWYTGAAAWYYKCFVETFLGIKFRGNRVYFSPKLPAEIKTATITLRGKFGKFRVCVENSADGEWRIVLNGVNYGGDYLVLSPSLNGKTVTLKRV